MYKYYCNSSLVAIKVSRVYNMALKSSFAVPSHENVFIRQALAQEIRLDGRGLAQYREMELTLSRGEMSSRAEVTVGNTRVVSIVSAEIAVPYPDRPTDGILQFNAEVSPMSDTTGAVSRAELTRLLERSIRESDAIDTESLCIVGGEKVWMINCDVRVLDFSGGNVVDAAMFAAMGALKAFRKPEIAVQVASYVGNPANSTSAATAVGDLTIFSSDEREPLPLALHHTPLSVTLGIFKGVRQSGSSSSSSANTSSSDKDTVAEVVLVADPSLEEERAMDGSLMFSINAHRELCAVHKPGEVAISAASVLLAAKMAADQAKLLHDLLAQALKELEENVAAERQARLERLRAARAALYFSADAQKGEMDAASAAALRSAAGPGGIDRDDPMLAYASLHKAAGLRNADS